MDPINDLYKNWVREEVESPEVQSARDTFLNKQFNASPAAAGPGFAFAPSFRLAMVGCLALFVLIKIGAFDASLTQTTPSPTLTEAKKTAPVSVSTTKTSTANITTPAAAAETPKNTVVRMSNIQIKKLTSQMGATMTYQKHFPDAQITVLWVLPKGV